VPAALQTDIDVAMTVEGQISPDEAAALAQLACQTHRGQDIVEIGSFRGRSTCALAAGARRGAGNRIYAVDPHTDFLGPRGGHYGPADQAELYANIVRLHLGELVAVVSLPSVRAARAWLTPSVGLLFIDGNHRYPAAWADFEAWYPHVLPGGTLAFHDVDLPDVARVVDEVVDAQFAEPVERVDTLLWLRKRTDHA
jgi:predicted O-methyltransferase YrrM